MNKNIKVFEPGSRTVSCLNLSGETHGAAFAQALEGITRTKLDTLQRLAAGEDQDSILKSHEKTSAALVKLINDNNFEVQMLFELSDILLALAQNE